MALRTFSAAEYASILQRRTVTATTFANLPLAEMPGALRGRLLTSLAREVDAALHPGALFEEAKAGRSVDGKRRGRDKAPYDWQRDGRRVACKSAQLKRDTHCRLCKLTFNNVKLGGEGTEAAFDELLLAAYTPRGIYLYRHDGRLGVSTSGKATAAKGSQIAVYGPRDEADWASALDEAVLPKLDQRGCDCLAFIAFDDPPVPART